MTILSIITVSIVIILHITFLLLEMFLWTKPTGRKIFSLSEKFAQETKTLAANQGLYNGFLAAGLIWGMLGTGSEDALIFFLSCIIIAGIYGAFTVKKTILWVQAMPALIALISVVFI